MVRIKDPVSGGLHLFAAALAIVGLIALIRLGLALKSPLHVLGYTVFSASMILLYLASSVHHLIPKSLSRAKLFRRIDHSMIFILIAGTYTPVCLIALKGPLGSVLLGVVWALSMIGIALKISGAKVSRRLSTSLYVGIGWAAVAAIVPLVRELSVSGFLWLLTGGVLYTIGASIYAMKKPNIVPKWLGFHEIFHLFVMAGSLSHFWSIFHYVR